MRRDKPFAVGLARQAMVYCLINTPEDPEGYNLVSPTMLPFHKIVRFSGDEIELIEGVIDEDVNRFIESLRGCHKSSHEISVRSFARHLENLINCIGIHQNLAQFELIRKFTEGCLKRLEDEFLLIG